jgi:sugar phosphate isomerase/epimerase
MAATHIHDNMGRGRERVGNPDSHLLPFDGTCDYVKMMRKLDEYEFTASLMLEVMNHTIYAEMTPEEFLATCYERIKKISEL